MKSVNEENQKLGFVRPKIGSPFLANYCLFVEEPHAVSTEGEPLLQLDTGWEGGLRWFVVPAGATTLSLVDPGTSARCDRIKFE